MILYQKYQFDEWGKSKCFTLRINLFLIFLSIFRQFIFIFVQFSVREFISLFLCANVH